MSRFDELVDEIFEKARTAADVAGKKTSEVVELGKLKYQAKQVTWDIEKTYSKLGAIVYESKKSTENFDDIIALAVEELDSLNKQLEDLEEKIMKRKDEFQNISYYPSSNAPAEEPVPDEAPVEVTPEPSAAPFEVIRNDTQE